MKPFLAVLTGAGMSAESGLKTFRDSGGLWEAHRIEDVATAEAWTRNPELLLRFYNERRRALKNAEPNAGHLALVELETEFKVQIITQNVDDLHERAGSTSVLHLHGKLTEARSVKSAEKVVNIGYTDIRLGDLHEDGSQLRPNIVWFGEAVPAMEEAVEIVSAADALLIVGTSLQVYPAASLLGYCSVRASVVFVDPHPPTGLKGIAVIAESATTGIVKAKRCLRP